MINRLYNFASRYVRAIIGLDVLYKDDTPVLYKDGTPVQYKNV